MDIDDRFWSKVDVRDFGGCWLWTAQKLRSGHGHFRIDADTKRLAHAFAWEILGNPIPEQGWFSSRGIKNTHGMVLDHDYPGVGCRNPSCVNPAHLVVTTQFDNQQCKRKLASNNTSGVRGVVWCPPTPGERRVGSWRVQVRHDGKLHHGGYFADLRDAERAAQMLATQLRRVA